MKKFILRVAMACLFLAVFYVQGYAEEKKDEKAHITVGVKTWINTYDQWERSGNNEYSVDVNTVTMVGPVVGITWDKYFAGISYLQTLNDYDYTVRQTNGTSTNTGKDKRKELDLSLGYYVHPRVGAFVGYKNVWWDINERDGGQSTVKLFGPAVGLTFNYPLGKSGFTPFATAAYYWLHYTQTATTSNPRTAYAMTGPSAEAGLAYTYRSITLTAGYKYHAYYSDNNEMTFGGPVFSINYAF